MTDPRAQRASWDEDRTAAWLRVADGRELQFAELTEVLFERAALQPGERVLDVGCGTGRTTVRAHELVGPDGRVTGNDVSTGMLTAARRHAGDRDIDWLLGDAETTDLGEGRYDVILSRFGVMFFADTGAAFANLSRACAPDGRLALAVWKQRPDAPVFGIPAAAIAPVLRDAGLPVPQPPVGPGPTRLGDPDALLGLLHDSGWRDVDIDDPDVAMHIDGGARPEVIAETVLDGGPAGWLVAGQPPEVVEAARRALVAAYAERWDGSGVAVRGGVWIVRARPAVV